MPLGHPAEFDKTSVFISLLKSGKSPISRTCGYFPLLPQHHLTVFTVCLLSAWWSTLERY